MNLEEKRREERRRCFVQNSIREVRSHPKVSENIKRDEIFSSHFNGVIKETWKKTRCHPTSLWGWRCLVENLIRKVRSHPKVNENIKPDGLLFLLLFGIVRKTRRYSTSLWGRCCLVENSIKQVRSHPKVSENIKRDEIFSSHFNGVIKETWKKTRCHPTSLWGWRCLVENLIRKVRSHPKVNENIKPDGLLFLLLFGIVRKTRRYSTSLWGRCCRASKSEWEC